MKSSLSTAKELSLVVVVVESSGVIAPSSVSGDPGGHGDE